MISHLNQKKDMMKAKRMGIEKYHEEQIAKRQILDKLLKEYDNGYRDVFFCLAVNLINIDDLNHVLNKSDELAIHMNLNEKSNLIKKMLNECAGNKGISLKLRNDGYYG